MYMILFGNTVLAHDQVKMRSSGWTLMQYDRCPCKKGKFGHRDRHVWGKNNLKRPREKMTIYKTCREAWNRSFVTRNSSADPLISDFLGSRTVRQKIPVGKATQCLVFCCGSFSKLIQIQSEEVRPE